MIIIIIILMSKNTMKVYCFRMVDINSKYRGKKGHLLEQLLLFRVIILVPSSLEALRKVLVPILNADTAWEDLMH